MEICLKWVHMARYELILRQDVRIILKPLLAPKGATSLKVRAKPAKSSSTSFFSSGGGAL